MCVVHEVKDLVTSEDVLTSCPTYNHVILLSNLSPHVIHYSLFRSGNFRCHRQCFSSTRTFPPTSIDVLIINIEFNFIKYCMNLRLLVIYKILLLRHTSSGRDELFWIRIYALSSLWTRLGDSLSYLCTYWLPRKGIWSRYGRSDKRDWEPRCKVWGGLPGVTKEWKVVVRLFRLGNCIICLEDIRLKISE